MMFNYLYVYDLGLHCQASRWMKGQRWAKMSSIRNFVNNSIVETHSGEVFTAKMFMQAAFLQV